jgi:5-methylcytosine-specific restriction protein A
MTSALRRSGSTRRWRQLRAAVLVRDAYQCWLCGLDGADSVDHVIPRTHGGTDDPTNLRAAHSRCNSSRGESVPDVPATSRTW